MNGIRGAWMPYVAQQARRMLLSNGALWAAMNSALSIQTRRVGQSSPKVGALRTSSQRRPWIPVNANCDAGGPDQKRPSGLDPAAASPRS